MKTYEAKKVASLTDSDPAPTEDINKLKNPRPSLIRGQEGYAYLLDEYLFEHCAACHGTNSFVDMPFASTDLGIAYEDALRYTAPNFLDSVSDNRFCGPDCNLDPDGEVYQAISEWLRNRN
jgi:hypothetical protein